MIPAVRPRRSALILAALLTPAALLATRPLPAAAGAVEHRHREEVRRLVAAAMESDGAWEKLTYLCDRIGHRLSGSPQLARAVEWAVESMELDGLANVRRQRVTVPHWVRGDESLRMTSPRLHEMPMLGLGRSIGTPPGGLSGGLVVVTDFDEFDRLSPGEVAGRFVLWNVPFTTYGATVKYRAEGARRASEKGAIASLVRSVGPRSLRTPHTGAMSAYKEGERRIPAAAVTIEDAELLHRLASRGVEVRLELDMDAHTRPDAESFNVMGEVPGRERPDEIVVIGGHLDSWDVGQGAMDDGGGCVVAMEAARLIRELGLQPRRTIRVVLWTNEENGTEGAKTYRASEIGDPARHFAAIESDGGVEAPWGFGVSVWANEDRDVDAARQQRVIRVVQEIGGLLRPVEADSVRAGGGGADISPLMEQGVPGLALRTPMDLYWDLHHTHADTVDKVDPEALRRNVAAMAVMAYVLADLPGTLD